MPQERKAILFESFKNNCKSRAVVADLFIEGLSCRRKPGSELCKVAAHCPAWRRFPTATGWAGSQEKERVMK